MVGYFQRIKEKAARQLADGKRSTKKYTLHRVGVAVPAGLLRKFYGWTAGASPIRATLAGQSWNLGFPCRAFARCVLHGEEKFRGFVSYASPLAAGATVAVILAGDEHRILLHEWTRALGKWCNPAPTRIAAQNRREPQLLSKSYVHICWIRWALSNCWICDGILVWK